MNKKELIKEEFNNSFEWGQNVKLDDIADWWIAQFDLHEKKIVDRVKKEKWDWSNDASDIHNEALDDVIKIIQEENK